MATSQLGRSTVEEVSFPGWTFAAVWLLALAAYGVGDVVTTVALVWGSPLHVEANPVVSAAIGAFGGGGFLGLKLLALYGCIAVSVWGGVVREDPFLSYFPPATLLVFGAVATAFNVSLML